MEFRHEILIIFMTYFYLTRVSVTVSALYKSETSDQNKEERKKFLPFEHFSLAFIFFLIHVLRHMYNLIFQNLFVLRNENC